MPLLSKLRPALHLLLAGLLTQGGGLAQTVPTAPSPVDRNAVGDAPDDPGPLALAEPEQHLPAALDRHGITHRVAKAGQGQDVQLDQVLLAHPVLGQKVPVGTNAGAVHQNICAAVLGLSAILASSHAAFNAIKLIGAAYLLYIAGSMLLSGRSKSEAAPMQPAESGWRLLRAAMLVNVLNPKVALFFLAFLPQFVDAAASVPALQILGLGLWFDAVATIVNIGIAIAAAAAATRLRQVAWLGTAARWFAASVLGGLALKLALSERR